MTMSTSRIPKRVRNLELKRARVDRSRIEVVHIDNSLPLKLTPHQVAMAGKIDAERRKQAPSHPVDPYAAFHDECCSKCQPPDNVLDKYQIPFDCRHMPWDEVELKKHKLLDQQCRYFAQAPVLDEVEMKARGLVDFECHRPPPQLDELTKEKAAEIGNRARQQLEKAQRSKEVMERKNRPHVKMCKKVEVVDDLKPSAPFSSSISSASEVVPSKKPLVSPEPHQSLVPSSQPTMNVAKIVANREPLVMTKTIETADGQFEFNVCFEVRFKPKSPAEKDCRRLHRVLTIDP